METKKMTIAEAQELVRNTKYIVWTEDDSKQLQEKLFEIGCKWASDLQVVRNTEQPFLVVDDKLVITYKDRTAYKWFEASNNKYMQVDDILKKEIEKPKFDPKTLQVFDKVLVRDSEMQTWRAKFFHCKKGEQFYTIDDTIYQICIPYNDETKHLHGTREDAPEFYNLD